MRRHGDPLAAVRTYQKRDNRTPDGYVRRYIVGRNQLEHRWAVERELGRSLWPWETVHHKNGRKDDNRLANLEVWVTPQPKGQRPADLVAWVVDVYPDLVRMAMADKGLRLL